jgi:hypothetical protein
MESVVIALFVLAIVALFLRGYRGDRGPQGGQGTEKAARAFVPLDIPLPRRPLADPAGTLPVRRNGRHQARHQPHRSNALSGGLILALALILLFMATRWAGQGESGTGRCPSPSAAQDARTAPLPGEPETPSACRPAPLPPG